MITNFYFIILKRQHLLCGLGAVFQCLSIQPFLEMIEVDTVLNRKTSCLGTAKGCKECSTIQSTTDVTCQITDVGSLTANYTNACRLLLVVVVGEFNLVHTYGLWLQLHVFSRTTKGIRAVTIHLHGTVGRWNLLDFAHKLLECFLYQFTGDVLGRESMIHTVLLIIASRSSTQL